MCIYIILGVLYIQYIHTYIWIDDLISFIDLIYLTMLIQQPSTFKNHFFQLNITSLFSRSKQYVERNSIHLNECSHHSVRAALNILCLSRISNIVQRIHCTNVSWQNCGRLKKHTRYNARKKCRNQNVQWL